MSTQVTVRTRQVKVAVGNRGPRGPQGLPGDGVEAINFSFGDATPIVISSSAGLLVDVSVVIEQPFNGAGAALSVTSGGAVLMSTAENLPAEAGRYESNPGVRVTAPTLLHIVPGTGTTAGRGAVYLRKKP